MSFRPDRLVLDGWELAGVIRNNTGGPYAPSLYCLNGVTDNRSGRWQAA